jgi:hypothetical protein
MKNPIYMTYGLALLGLVGYGQWRGFSFDQVNRVENVPKSIRENPGAYRSHYGFWPIFRGGK